jgi:uncharacterized membrane protein
MEHLILIGVVVVFVGIALVIIGSLAGGEGKGGAKIAVGGFIGPIPFGFSNDRQMLYVVITLAIIMLFISLLFMLGQKTA